jgi:hypothetical protein
VETLHWILFRSRPTTAPWPNTILDLARVIERNNSECGATGMLLFSNNAYLQYVEASPDALDAIWARVVDDDRHRIDWWLSGVAQGRRFPGLPLGYFDADRERSQVAETPIWHDRQDWQPEQAEALVEMLETIAREKYPDTMSGGGEG